MYKTGAKSHHSSEVNMTPRWMFSASLLLAVAQANSLYPASTFPLRVLSRSPRLGNERTLYTGFQPPVQALSYEDYKDYFALTRTLGKKNFFLFESVSFTWSYGATKQYFSRKYYKTPN